MKEKIAFVSKVAAVHTATYILCGLIAMIAFGYQDSLAATGMRETTDPIVGMAPLFQLVRGALFGIVLWLLRPVFVRRKHGWLIVWAVVVIVGIVNTPGTAPGSIEGFIYLVPADAPANTNVGGMIEILTQTLLFSAGATWWVKRTPKRKNAGAPYSTEKSSDPKFA